MLSRLVFWFFIVTAASVAAPRSLVVISVDGLDHRYLRDADKLELKIPNLRRLMREGLLADGVTGVVPTITWPSHTTLISGVTPQAHGILGNRRPKSEGGDYYWSANLLKSKTLLDAARAKGLKSAAITWPVTVDAPVDFNLPEYFLKRRGGAMDLAGIESKATTGLVEEIANAYPSFAQEWMDDRTRTLATMYLLRAKKPDLLLLHLVDHDAEAHDNGPFSRAANASVEHTDELIGDIVKSAPGNAVIAIVSDHGFERTDKVENLKRHLPMNDVSITPFLLIARTEAAAKEIRALKLESVGREIPRDELLRFPDQRLNDAVAVWEPAPHFAFGTEGAEPYSKPHEIGNHGLWPGRHDYRSVFLMWGAGIKPGKLPELQMVEIAAKFAAILDLPAPK